jgi:hypothetical protein
MTTISSGRCIPYAGDRALTGQNSGLVKDHEALIGPESSDINRRDAANRTGGGRCDLLGRRTDRQGAGYESVPMQSGRKKAGRKAVTSIIGCALKPR